MGGRERESAPATHTQQRKETTLRGRHTQARSRLICGGPRKPSCRSARSSLGICIEPRATHKHRSRVMGQCASPLLPRPLPRRPPSLPARLRRAERRWRTPSAYPAHPGGLQSRRTGGCHHWFVRFLPGRPTDRVTPSARTFWRLRQLLQETTAGRRHGWTGSLYRCVQPDVLVTYSFSVASSLALPIRRMVRVRPVFLDARQVHGHVTVNPGGVSFPALLLNRCLRIRFQFISHPSLTSR